MKKNCTYFDKETTVSGDLLTDDVILEGSFEGTILAKEKILLKKSAQINAKIEARKLMVEEGAILNGTVTLHNGDR